jgi:quinoprotein glucose dehydrogenase
MIVSLGARALPLVVLLVLVSEIGSARQKQQEPSNWNWETYGGEPQDAHYVPLDQINKSNVDQLKIAWAYRTQDQSSYSFNPIEVDGALYVLAKDNSLVALNAATGEEIWVHAGLAGIANRGIAYWQSKDGTDRRLIFQVHNQLQEIDARTGKSILNFGTNGFVDLMLGLRRPVQQISAVGWIQSFNPGTVYGDLVIEGSFTGEQYLAPPGDVRAYNIITGKQVWQFHAIPHPGDPGYNTWSNKDAWKYAGGAGLWGDSAIDPQRGIIFFPTGGTKFEFYGADRKGEGLFGSSLVALDVHTGKYLWSFQAVHHDVWDYDMAAAPQLITVDHDGKKIDAVALAGKTCFLYVLNRVTGEPIWPIVEQKVPRGDMSDEKLWPTQPFPTAPPPFCKQQFTAADINPYLSQAQQKALADRLANDVNGPLFTPPETQETIEMPGNQGGASWGMTASDPEKGMAYILAVNAPALIKMTTQSPYDVAPGAAGVSGGTPGHVAYQEHCQQCHGPDRAGSASIPPLVDVTRRLDPVAIRSMIEYGSGRMPALGGIVQDDQIDEIISYLRNPSTGGQAFEESTKPAPVKLGGDVVGWGRAPAGQAAYADRSTSNPWGVGVMAGAAYPTGVNAPGQRYYTGWNIDWDIIGPPWETLTAYDLNKGTMKWQVSVGTSPGLMTKQLGAVVTSSGLVFLATKDGKVRAYDAGSGKILWTGDLPAGAYGIPAMYEWAGREYLVICATTPLEKPATLPGMDSGESAPNSATDKIKREYVGFALPAEHD